MLGADSRTSTGSYVANRCLPALRALPRTNTRIPQSERQDRAHYGPHLGVPIRLGCGYTGRGGLCAALPRGAHVSLCPAACLPVAHTSCRIRSELGRLPKVKTAANIMRKICYNNKVPPAPLGANAWHLTCRLTPQDGMMAGLIVGGWDPYEGGQVSGCRSTCLHS